MSGVKTTLTAVTPTSSHVTQAAASGQSATAMHKQVLEQVTETINALNTQIKATPNANFTASAAFTTSVATISFATALPTWVVSGMSVFDVTNSNALGTVSSGGGTTTLTMQANALHASTGSNDVIQISDANLATFQAQLAALS